VSKHNWAEALALANRLGLAPKAFWSLSLMEWHALTRPGAPRPLNRAELNALHANYTDKSHD